MKIFLSFRRISVTFFLTIGLCTESISQNPLLPFPDSTYVRKTAVDTVQPLSIVFSSQSFLKNNEYFGLITEGYTLFGYWANPGVHYQMTDRLSLRAGLWAQKYFGLDQFSRIAPSYTAIYAPSNRFGIEIGDLSWSRENLPLPLMSEERPLVSPQHEGLLIRAHYNYIYTCTWIEWEEFLFHQEDKQEEMNLCTSNQLTLFQNSNIKLSVPFQAVVHHRGGQINAAPKKDFVMVLNNAAGADIKLSMGNTVIHSQYLFCGYSDLATAPYSSFQQGYGHLASVIARGRSMSAGYSYWSAYQYVSPLGAQLLNTVSDIPDAPYSEHSRDLSMLYFAYQKDISSDAYFTTGAMGYFDHNNKATEYYYWFNLAINIDKKLHFAPNKPTRQK